MASINVKAVSSSQTLQQQQQQLNQSTTLVDEHRSKIWYEGWLQKEGRFVKSWKRRYFVLKGNKLLYYKNEQKADSELKGSMDIDGCEVRFLAIKVDGMTPSEVYSEYGIRDIQDETEKLMTETSPEYENSNAIKTTGNDNATAATTTTTALILTENFSRDAERAPTDSSRYIYKFCVVGSDRSLFMATYSSKMLKEWIAQIRNCISVENYFRDCFIYSSIPSYSVVRVLSDSSWKQFSIQNDLMTINDMKCVSGIFKRNKNLIKLCLKNVGLTNSFMKILASGFANNEVLQIVDLSQNRIGDEGILDLSDGLYLNIHITNLILSYNLFSDIGAIALSDVLKANVSITKLDLSYNNIGAKGAQSLADMVQVNFTLKELNLNGNNLGDVGVAYLSDGLKNNKTIEKLYLAFNKIGSDGIIQLCQSLTHNRSIKDLDLHGNNFDKASPPSIVAMLKDHKSLTRLDLGSNIRLGSQGISQLSELLKSRFFVSKLVMTRGQLSSASFISKLK